MVCSPRNLAVAATILSVLPALVVSDQQAPITDTDSSDSIIRLTVFPTTDQSCTSDGGTEPISIPVEPEVCLWSAHEWDDSIQVDAIGRCENGATPYLALYASKDCTGYHSHPNYWEPSPRNQPPFRSRCLTNGAWSASLVMTRPPRGPWSMAFMCPKDGSTSFVTPGRDAADIVQLPTRARPAWKNELARMHLATPAVVQDSVCGVPSYSGKPAGHKALVEPDVCTMLAPRGRLNISQPALCPNGTRALLARWSQSICKGEPAVLREIGDAEVGKCLDLGSWGWTGYTFWCTGHPYATPRSRIHPSKLAEMAAGKKPAAAAPERKPGQQSKLEQDLMRNYDPSRWVSVEWTGKEWRKVDPDAKKKEKAASWVDSLPSCNGHNTPCMQRDEPPSTRRSDGRLFLIILLSVLGGLAVVCSLLVLVANRRSVISGLKSLFRREGQIAL